MPLKSDLDEVTTESFITGACNTVVKTKTQKNGGRVRLVGTNTDFLGESGSGRPSLLLLQSNTNTALTPHSYRIRTALCK
jgi:hypothetical protein